jgi:hypothetical protein
MAERGLRTSSKSTGLSGPAVAQCGKYPPSELSAALPRVTDSAARIRALRYFGSEFCSLVLLYMGSSEAHTSVHHYPRSHLPRTPCSPLSPFPTSLHHCASLAARDPHISDLDKHPLKYRYPAEACATHRSTAWHT